MDFQKWHLKLDFNKYIEYPTWLRSNVQQIQIHVKKFSSHLHPPTLRGINCRCGSRSSHLKTALYALIQLSLESQPKSLPRRFVSQVIKTWLVPPQTWPRWLAVHWLQAKLIVKATLGCNTRNVQKLGCATNDRGQLRGTFRRSPPQHPMDIPIAACWSVLHHLPFLSICAAPYSVGYADATWNARIKDLVRAAGAVWKIAHQRHVVQTDG